MRWVAWVLLLGLGAPACAQLPLPPGPQPSHQVAGGLVREWLKKSSAHEHALLEGARREEITVVEGSMDHLELLLQQAGIPFAMRGTSDPVPEDANPRRHLIMVNCPGHGVSLEHRARLRSFVRAGGWLMTTDWALQLVGHTFPGYVQPSGGSTLDEVVKVDIHDPLHPLVHGVMADGSDARWWLEGASYPIQILKPDQVRVLLHSPEMKAKYGHDPVAVHFEYGLGTVFHLTSHFHLKRSPMGGGPADDYVVKHLAGREVSASAAAAAAAQLGGVSRREFESVYTIMKFLVRVVVENRQRESDR